MGMSTKLAYEACTSQSHGKKMMLKWIFTSNNEGLGRDQTVRITETML